MADNPLLPQQRLRELYALTQQIKALERKQSNRSAAREALLAAIRIHLRANDLLSGPAEDRTVRKLASELTAGPELPSALRLPLAAGVARGMQAAEAKNIAVAMARAGARETGWADALSWAHRDELPMLLVCFDVPGTRRSRSAEDDLTWTTVSKHAQRLRMPLFPVDGDDAVAVYRVMQEASQRARDGLGPSVLWAVLAAAPPRRNEQPLSRLAAYMRTRGMKPDADGYPPGCAPPRLRQLH